jgi:NAD-dependent dihydropyrimidine dehydrogenase PreA subunit
MALRKIIRIDEALCNGCGECATACSEGALAIVDGKARIVKERYCDGFGDCIGECPTGALVIEEREADSFDFEATRAHVERTGGFEAVRRLEDAAAVHEARHAPRAAGPSPAGGGCPGSRARFDASSPAPRPVEDGAGPRQAIPSELKQWPVQLHLVQPGAPFFRGKELVLLNSCGAVASADVHWRFLRGRSVAIACPKLDDTAPYVAKLAAILRDETIPRVAVVRMEVPCCGGLTMIARQAALASGRGDLVVDEITIGLGGDVGAARAVVRSGAATGALPPEARVPGAGSDGLGFIGGGKR